LRAVNLYLSLGSNLGDRESNIAQATMALAINFEISDIQSSSYYDSDPLYNIDQPNFLNSVVKCKTTLKPFDVLDVIRKVETMLGRAKVRMKNQPRIIDIDILFHDDAIIETEELTIPHPMLSVRKFVLIPFAELEPNFKIPHSQITINDLIKHCPDKTRVMTHYMDTQA
jgi:2-amino-4-hydroxy-6-hydroxymethyldihydropteridine diphosphokinase|tara:strand:+ start:6109 stop:6618 length:510 start_codon:yes stop_codon:yes gene_type:complete